MSHFGIHDVIVKDYESQELSDNLMLPEMFNKYIGIDKSCLNSKMHLR